MSELRNLHENFQNYLLENKNTFQDVIDGTLKFPINKRLAIYSNAYRLRLLDVLISNYPVVYAYLGDDNFKQAASDYIQQYPSTFRSIRWFGNQLPAFFGKHPEYHAYPYLCELAEFEWLQTLVFDAVDKDILEIDQVTQIPPESWMDMRLRVHPSVRRINFSWNIVQIWQAIMNEQIPPEPIQTTSHVPWVLWRKDLINQFCSLTEDEAWSLDAMMKGSTFGEICEGLCQLIAEQEVGQHAASLLKGWIVAGLLSEVY